MLNYMQYAPKSGKLLLVVFLSWEIINYKLFNKLKDYMTTIFLCLVLLPSRYDDDMYALVQMNWEKDACI